MKRSDPKMNKNRKKRVILLVILFILIVVFVVCAILAGCDIARSKREDDANQEIVGDVRSLRDQALPDDGDSPYESSIETDESGIGQDTD